MPSDTNAIPFELPHHLDERAIALNDKGVREDAEFVLCWLHHAIRAHENPALDTALTLGNALGKPVLVYQGLGGRHRFNSDRHHVFIMQGARDLQRDLAEKGVAFAFHLPTDPAGASPLRELIARSCAVITEDFPVPPFPKWYAAHAERSSVSMVAVDSACVMPVRALGERHDRAFKFRKAAQREWDIRLAQAWEDVEPEVGPLALGALPFEPVDLQNVDLATLASACEIDHSIPAVHHTHGGSDAGYARWEMFKQDGLRSYANRRNNALDPDGVSRMSAYLHHGHVSALRIAREANEVGGKGAEKFLDELLTWRELSYNFCAHTDELERLSVLPSWASQTLREHASDEREAIYTWERLRTARTEDELWNGAQRSLLWSGELHNNLRMTWGKMIPQWTRTPDEALRLLIDLNHRYALDGNNPNSYGGLLWCLGQFDRPFTPEGPVLGSVRGRDTQTHAKRLDPTKFNAMVKRQSGHAPLRVCVIGAGIAGLSCARTLADYGAEVSIYDKGRGPGGRCATRFADDDRFDHGAPWFEVTDPRFGRYVKPWIESGVAAIWNGRFARVTDDGLVPIEPERPRVVGVPGMNALCAHMGEGLDVEYGRRALSACRDGDAWSVVFEDGARVGGFDRVVIAVPPRQASGLLEPISDSMYARVRAIETSPRWTLMLTLDAADSEDVAFDALGFEDGALELLVRNDAKPGRAVDDGRSCWVAHASEAWSREHLEDDGADVRGAMTELVRTYLGAGETLHAAAHRWRYARTTRTVDEACLFDDESGIACCADGFAGVGVQSAFLSGQAAAGRILAMRPIEHNTISAPESLFAKGNQ